jgi:adenylate cyclase
MLSDLERLNREWAAEAKQQGLQHTPVRIGIGINTAACCVGNLGSEHRFDYSVVGDGVNVASRLEGRSKVYGVPIVVGETTAAQLPELAFLEIDYVSVHGRAEPLHIYGLIGDADYAKSPVFLDLRARHDAMLTAFRSRRFDEAAALLAQARQTAGDSLAALYDGYAQRIAEFQQFPPPPDWDGSSIAESK